MNCDAAGEALSAALDGELDAAALQALDAHLTQCAACRALGQELALLQEACGPALEAEAPADLKERILTHLPPQKAAVRVIYWRRWAGVAAAVVVIAALALWQLPRLLGGSQDNASSAPMAAGAAQESVTVDQAAPVEGADWEATAQTPGSDAAPAAIPAPQGQEDAGETGSGAMSASVTSPEEEKQQVLFATEPSSAPQPLPTSQPSQATENAFYNYAVNAPTPPSNSLADGLTEYGEETEKSIPEDEVAVEECAPEEPGEDGEARSGGGLRLNTALTAASKEDLREEIPQETEEDVLAEDWEEAEVVSDVPPYAAVLTLDRGAPLGDYPQVSGPEGQRWYYLPLSAFHALVEELEEENAPFTLRETGEDLDREAALGLVVVKDAGQ